MINPVKLDQNIRYVPAVLFGMAVLIFLTGCAGSSTALPLEGSKPPLTITAPLPVASATVTASIPQPTPTITGTTTPIPTIEPAECKAPPEDYELVNINGNWLNKRTLAMLEYAQALYNGEIDLTGYAITQGSFNDNGAASFGTHLGGGAVDLSVMRAYTYTVLYDDIPEILQALRLAGFAAWLREPDEVYPGSAIHIHAIAIGDRDLSDAAIEQLDGDAGYFKGYSGLPPVNDTPTDDRFGGPVVCQWMRDAGYEDLRPTPINPEQDKYKKCLCDD